MPTCCGMNHLLERCVAASQIARWQPPEQRRQRRAEPVWPFILRADARRDVVYVRICVREYVCFLRCNEHYTSTRQQQSALYAQCWVFVCHGDDVAVLLLLMGLVRCFRGLFRTNAPLWTRATWTSMDNLTNEGLLCVWRESIYMIWNTQHQHA